MSAFADLGSIARPQIWVDVFAPPRDDFGGLPSLGHRVGASPWA